MPTELRRHLETEKQGRQLHIINGSVYYRVTFTRWDWADNDPEAFTAALTLPRGHWDDFS